MIRKVEKKKSGIGIFISLLLMVVVATLFKELNNENIIGGEILGGKTGYTYEAGLCLASLAKVGKQEYILITAGAKGDHHTNQYNITDALAVYNSIGK